MGTRSSKAGRWCVQRGLHCTLAALLLCSCGAFDPERLGAAPSRRPEVGGGAGAPGGGDGDGDGDVEPTRDAGKGPLGAGGGSSGAGGANGGSADGGVTAIDRDAGGVTDDPVDGGDDGGSQDASTADGGEPCTESAAEDVCTGIPELAAAPVIDGVLDCGPKLAAITPTAWNGTAALPSGHTTQLAVAHRSDGLYVYVEVRGQVAAPHPDTTEIYCGDAIELYVDADGVLDAAGSYDNPGTMQIIVAAPASAAAPNPHAERYLQGSTQGAWTSSAWQVAWLSDGYALEAFVAAADLGLSSWSPSGSIGLDLVIDVAGPASSPDLGCGLQLGQYFLRVQADATGCGGEPWCDARAFCTPALR